MDPAPASVITARPWFNGAPLPEAYRGLVLGAWGSGPGDVLVWFPTRGLPTEAGLAVQPILAREIRTITDLAACPEAWLADAYDRARQSRTLTALPTSVGIALERAARAARRARPTTTRTHT